MTNWVEKAKEYKARQNQNSAIEAMNEENLLTRWGRGYDYAHKGETGYTSLSKRWDDLYKRAVDYYNNEAYTDFYNSYSGTRNKSGYVSDTGTWYSDLDNKRTEANKGADALLAELGQYSRYYNADAVSYVRDLITKRKNSYDDLMKDAGIFRDHWSQWATEDDYNNAVFENDLYQLVAAGKYDEAKARVDSAFEAAKQSNPDSWQSPKILQKYNTYAKDVDQAREYAEYKPLIDKYDGMSKEELAAALDDLKVSYHNSVSSEPSGADPVGLNKARDEEIEREMAFVLTLMNEKSAGTKVLNAYKNLMGKSDEIIKKITGADVDSAKIISGASDVVEYVKKLGELPEYFQNSALFEDGYHRGDVLGTIGSTVFDTGVNVLKGASNAVEGIVDLGAYGVAGLTDAAGNEELAEAIRKATMKSQTDQLWGRLHDAANPNSVFSDHTDGLVQSIAQMYTVGFTAAAAGLGKVGTSILNSAGMGLSAMGSSMGEAYQGKATDGEAWAYGAMSGAVEVVSELIFGGMGKAVNAIGFSKGLSSLDDQFAKKLSEKISSQFWKNMVEFGVKASAEGVEELLAGVGSIAAKKLTYMSEADLLDLIADEHLLEQFVSGVLMSGFAQSGYIPGTEAGSLREANKTGRDFITGFTADGQKYIDTEYQARIAEAENGGKKLSRREKLKIYDDVLKTVTIDEGTRNQFAKIDAAERGQVTADIEKKISAEISDKKARAQVAETLTKVAYGEHVSNAELRKVANSKKALKVLSELTGTKYKAGDVTVRDLRQAITPLQKTSARLSSANVLATYAAHFNMDEIAERSLMVSYANDVKNAGERGVVAPEVYAEAYNRAYVAGKRGTEISEISGKVSSVLSDSAIAQAYRAGEMVAAANAKSSAQGNAKAAHKATTSKEDLLGSLEIGKIDSNKSYYKLDDLGISKEDQAAWMAAGIAQERDIRGEKIATVNTTVLQDELKRREKSSAKVLQNDGESVAVKEKGDKAISTAEVENSQTKENAIEPERVVYSSKTAKAYDAMPKDKLSKEQKRVVDVGAQIGRKVIFATTVNGSGVEVDGFIAKNGDIYINPNKNVAPIAFVFKHELAHFAQRAGQKYRDFSNAVIQSATFKQWLKDKGFRSMQAYNTQLREERAAVGESLDESGTNREIIANFVGDMLFGDGNTLTEDLIRELQPKQRKSVREYIREFFSWVKGKFAGDAGKAAFEVRKLEKMFANAYQEACKSTTDANGEQFAFNGAFGQQLKDWQRGNGKANGSYNGKFFRLGTTPDVLIKHGAPAGEVIMYEDCLLKITGLKHSISIDELAKIPSQLNDPILLFKGSVDNSFVALTEIKDKLGNDVIVAVHINKKIGRSVINKITSVYSKTDDFGNNKIVNYVSEQIKKGNLLDVSAKKAPNWFTTSGLQLPHVVQTILDANNSISQNSEKSTQNSKKVLNDGGENFSYTPQNDKIADGFERIRSGELSINEAEKLLTKPEGDNPATIASLKKEEMGSTPKINKKINGNAGGGDSKFADSVQRSSIFNEEFKKEVGEDSFVKHYAAITNKETLAEAAKRLDQGGEAYVAEWLSKKAVHMDTVDTVVGFILLKRYQDVSNYEGATAVAQKVRDVGTLSGQRVQAFSILGRFDADMMQAYAQKELDRAWELAIEGRSDKWLEKHKEQFKLTDEDISFIRDNIMYAAQMPENSRERAIALAQITTLIQSKIPPVRGQSFKAWQRVSMLLNPRTQLRNVAGNAMMAPVFVASDWFSTPLDLLISKSTGVRTTGLTGLHGSKANLNAMGKGFAESYDDWKRHINTKADEQNRFEIGQGKSFDETKWGRIAKIMNSFDRFNSFLLDAGDRPFYEMWFINSLNEQMRLNNVSEPTEAMVQIAVDEALSRTWQDENRMTKLVTGIKKAANQISIGGYGMGDVLIKFTKTPANLTKAIYDFSPAAIATITPQAIRLTKAIKNGTATPSMQKKFVSSFGKMAAGTMLYVIFAALYAAGHIKGSSDEDKDVAAFEKYVQGIPEYSIKIGDKWFSYDWAQPIGAVPAIIADYMESRKEGSTAIDSVLNAFKAGGEVLFNQSFMTSFKTLFSADSFSEGVLDITLGEVSVPVPTIFSQLANVLDSKRRVTYDGTSEFKSALNRAILKIPGLRNLLEAEVDVLGREVDNSQKSWFNAFLNPANVYTDTSTEVTDHAYEIYQSTGDAAAIPPKAPYSVTLQGTTVKLDDVQRAQYQRAMGETASDLIEILLDNDVYKAMSDEEKLSVLKQVYSYAATVAKGQLEWADEYEVISGIAPYITKKDFEAMSYEERYQIVEEYIFSDYDGMQDIESEVGQSNFMINKKTSNLVLSATLAGDIDEAVKLIEGIDERVESYGWSKADTAEEIKERKTSVKSTLTRYWKQAYLYAYYKKDTEEQNRILEMLTKTGLYGDKSDVKGKFAEWVEAYEEENQ